MKCECPDDESVPKSMMYLYSYKEKKKGMNHKAFECKCTNNLKYYIRDGKKICLCSKCHTLGDKEIQDD